MDSDEQSRPACAANSGEPAGRVRWPARMVAALARHRWLSAVGLVVVLGVVAAATVTVIHLRQDWHERISGPFGGYPAGFSSGAPTRLLRQVGDATTLIDGLALVPFNGSDSAGESAVDVRTGRVYWTDRRPDQVVYTAAGPGGSAYLLWDDGLLTRVDARRARILWQTHLDLGNEGAAIWGADAHSVVVVSQRKAVAVTTAGAVRWTVTPPAGRAFNPGWPVLAGNTVALEADQQPVPDEGWSYMLQAYDRTTGRLRWRRTDSEARIVNPPVPLAAGGDTILIHHDADDNAIRVDAATGRRLGPLQAGPVSAVAADARFVAGESDGHHLGAWDARTGKLLWAKRFGSNQDVGDSGGPALNEDLGRQAIEDLPRVCCVAVTGNLLNVVSFSLGSRKLKTTATTRPERRLWLTSYEPRTGAVVRRTRIPVIVPRSLTGAGRAEINEYRTSVDAEITAQTSGGLLAVKEEGDGLDGPTRQTVILAP